MGQAPPSSDCNFDGRGTPFVKAGEFGSSRPVIREWTTNPLKRARKSDVLLCVVGATCGKLNLGEDCAIGRSVAALRPEPGKLNQFYLHYFLMTLVGRLRSGSVGAAQTVVSKEMIQSLPFPWRELSEQQRIVAILDKAFEGIATAEANAGKNLQNARELFDGYLQSVFAQPNPAWVQKRLQDVSERITDGTHQTPKYFDSGVVFLSSRNVTSGKIDWDNIKYIDERQHIEMHHRVAPRVDDILLAKNGTTGVAAIVDRDTTFDIYVSLALIRSLGEVLPRFLLRFINSPAAKMQFNKRLKGVGVPNLHLEEIREVTIQFPASLEEQQQVVDRAEEFHREVEALERIQQRKLAALDELKKSLLHQAFNGQL
jgi:type I restriction enzyme S subunit